MKLILIAAINRKGVLGNHGTIPWYIPEDLHRFKILTVPHAVLMGRKTFQSIGKPLPLRKNVVLSRDPRFHDLIMKQHAGESVSVFASLESALASLAHIEKVFVIGGGEVFRQTIDSADELHLTLVDNDDEGDVFFPSTEEFLKENFTLIHGEKRSGFRFCDYVRKSP